MKWECWMVHGLNNGYSIAGREIPEQEQRTFIIHEIKNQVELIKINLMFFFTTYPSVTDVSLPLSTCFNSYPPSMCFNYDNIS